MFDPNDVFSGGSSKFLNAKYLKSLPKMAVRIRILDGGTRMVADYNDKTKERKEAYLVVDSPDGVFEGTKDMPLNKTNFDILALGLGKTPSAWIGRVIGAYFDPLVKVGDEVKGGLRVKVFEADPFSATPAPAAAPAPALEDAPF